jgi:glutamine amidotransferase
MSTRIGVIDYGRGNLRSVGKALESLGAEVTLLGAPDGMENYSAIVLPGVGSFGDCAHRLADQGFIAPLQEWIRADRPFLGICLGYQILFASSEESPGAAGLGVFPGQVKKFAHLPGRKIPHMGWNQLQFPRPSPLFAGLPENTFAYFVHSFYPEIEESSLVSSWCDYDGPFAASLHAGRVQAVQFHPEKSQAAGLRMLENFLHSI